MLYKIKIIKLINIIILIVNNSKIKIGITNMALPLKSRGQAFRSNLFNRKALLKRISTAILNAKS